MSKNEISFDVQHLIDEVAARHRLVFRPDDAAFALVTMNQIVLGQALETIHRRVLDDLASFETAGRKLEVRVGAALGAEMRQSAEAVRRQIQGDIRSACLQAAQIVQQLESANRQHRSDHRYTIVGLAVTLVLAIGIWVGRLSTLWWPR